MEWQIFAESDRQSPAPAFRLPSTTGRWISLDDYRQNTNLVLIFPHTIDCAGCADALRGFGAHLAEYEAAATAVLAIFPAPLEALTPLVAADENQVPRLADTDGRVRRAYAELSGEDDAGADMVFVLDRYGAPLVARSGGLRDPALHDEIQKWLTYSEIKCADCGGVVEWFI